MPIAVVCPGCKARFSVSDKFAGKKGPCPKCKQIIQVPAEAAPEIKIAEPEAFGGGGKDAKGRPVLKPIARVETKVRPVTWAAIAGGTLLAFGVALVLRNFDNKLPAVILGLLIISPPLAVGGYFFLRNDELEAYSGKALWTRAAICALAYAALWGFYYPLAPYLSGEVWQWLFVAPVFIACGAGAALALFDLDFGTGALHYSFYLLVTLMLRAATGLPPLWRVSP